MKQYEVDLLVKKMRLETKNLQLNGNMQRQASMLSKIKNVWCVFSYRFSRWNR